MLSIARAFKPPMTEAPKKILNSLHAKILNLKINGFRPKVMFNMRIGNFTVKTADTPTELREVLKLRYQIFTKEYGVKLKFQDMDFDRYDLLGDHVLVIDNETSRILATYRVISSLFSDRFYSQSEFVIDEFLRLPGTKMELGRACVHEDFRTGACISLVWKGIAKYATLIGAEHMFGCTSVDTTDAHMAMAVFRTHSEPEAVARLGIQPTPKYQFEEYPELVSADLMTKVDSVTPSLMVSYLKAGAKILALPAVDRAFNCVDFFTVLELKEIDPKYLRKYF